MSQKKNDDDSELQQGVPDVNVTRGMNVKATVGQLWSWIVLLIGATIFLWTIKMDQGAMREDINKMQQQMEKMSTMVYEMYYQKKSVSSVPDLDTVNS